MLLTGWGWAVSSPLESSPDDDYHLGSIWCPRPVNSSCETSVVDGKPVVRVPVAVADSSMRCFVFQPDKSAACTLGYDDNKMVWSTRYDDGGYPVGYYRFHHLLIGEDVQTSALVMRGVNVLISVFLLGSVGFCSPQRLRRPFIAAIMASWVPMGIYFIASNNPSSWAVSGLLVYSSAMYMATQQEGRARIALMLCAIAGAGMCVASRYDASFYLLVVGLAILLAVRWTRQRWPELCLVVGAAFVGVCSMMLSSHVADVADPAKGPVEQQSFLEKLIVGIETAPKYLGGFWGHAWNPGWTDIPLGVRSPFILTVMAAGAFVAIALRRGGWRKWLVLVTLIGAIVGLPAVFHANGAFEVIDAYQARYILPLLAPTFFFALALDQDEEAWFTVPQAVWIVVCGALCQTISLHTTLLRYVHGIKEPWELNLNEKIEWWWSVPVSPMMVWFITTCTATAAFGIIMSMLTRRVERQSS
ncbi:DUF2142 domain-containing protein [Actinomyces sp. ZJ308]|uniref:DUF2142 domain-containing protein n=1 Tax=Actinomyces sp. ZJ308 TaxID=2708342 RepID=UPI001420A8BC|nr:DUF2142 domain-containing protein [Actinomyces sp. ZJ308]